MRLGLVTPIVTHHHPERAVAWEQLEVVAQDIASRLP
jgi:hypothetical protein